MAGERTPEEIQRDIEQARESLASAVDQLAYRTNPKRVRENVKQSLLAQARTPAGQAALAAAGFVVLVVVVRRVRRR